VQSAALNCRHTQPGAYINHFLGIDSFCKVMQYAHSSYERTIQWNVFHAVSSAMKMNSASAQRAQLEYAASTVASERVSVIWSPRTRTRPRLPPIYRGSKQPRQCGTEYQSCCLPVIPPEAVTPFVAVPHKLCLTPSTSLCSRRALSCFVAQRKALF